MLRKLLPLLVIGVWGVTVVPLPERASATTPLTRAEIQKIRNLVQLMPKNREHRPARRSDVMFPGDGVSTGRASLAELRFNDRSLARVGEQAIFQFLPRTRNFKLSNGTVFLLIPPKQGRTRIQTPNAAAAIRGSALFVRYDEQTDTTIVGALTNSGIEVSNKDASQSRVLEAGQMLIIVKDRIQGLYDFDLRTFYETSDLVRGLDLTRKSGAPSADPAIAQVQEETVTAVAAQKPVIGAGVIENPSFVQLTVSSPSVPTNNITNSNSLGETTRTNSPVETLVDIGQVLSNNDKKKDNSSGSTSVTTLPVINPPKIESPTNPPKIESPTNPPKIESPTNPPKIESPTNPPKIESPTNPPKIESPTNPPKIESPTNPPKIESPTNPPKIESPTNPPKIESPTNPPKIESPTNPPKIESPTNPPKIDPPTNPPKIDPPTNPPKIDPPTNPPKIDPPTNPPKIDPPTNPPKIDPPTNPPKIDPPTNPPKIDPPTNPPKIDPPTNPPKIDPPTDPPVTPPVKPST